MSLNNDFETIKCQRALPDQLLDSTGIKNRKIDFFRQHAYFQNALISQDKIEQSDNYLEIKFVEKVLAPLLNNQGLLRVKPQRNVGQYQVDFAIEGASKFAIEVDGFGKFRERSDLNGFIQRQNYIASQGWRVIRFTYSQIMKDTEATLKLLYSLFINDPQLRSFLAIQKNKINQQSIFTDFCDPQMIDTVNDFYHVQDCFVEMALSNEQSIEPILLQDNFGFNVPFVALSISELYKFLEAVQSVVDIDFRLPIVEIIANFDYLEKWTKNLHPLVSISNTYDDRVIFLSTEVVQFTPASLPAPPLGAGTVRFRKGLTLQEIHQGFKYFTSEVFGYSFGTNNFQDRVIQRVFDGEHVLGISTTGSGKSFCFWLPALLKPGLTIVICPLRSLMRDQRLTLFNYGISSVEFINSDVDRAKQHLILEEVKLGYIRLLYISPERLRIKRFLTDLAELKKFVPINFLAVDEAHCISEWGHDFRPSYLKLPLLRETLSTHNEQLQLIALTATAGQQVEKDMLGILKLRDGHVIREPSADRERFSYQIVAVQEGATKAQTYRQILTRDLPKALRQKSLTKLLEQKNPSGEKSLGIVFCIYADPHGKNSIWDGTAHYLYETMALLEPEARWQSGPLPNKKWQLQAYSTGKVRAFASKPPTLCPNCFSYAFTSKSAGIQNADDEEVEDDDEEKLIGQNAGIKSCSYCNFEFKATDVMKPPQWETLIKDNQNDFKDDRFDILVATKGFGMGIDKSSVRFIIHTSLSSGLESWYQEIGRAGRDNERAHIVLLVDPPNELCLNELEKLTIKRPLCSSYQGGCPHGKQALCDYGKQHMFIIRSYPGAESDAISALRVLDKLIAACEEMSNNSVVLHTSRTYLSYTELAIYRLTVLGLVNDYMVTYPYKQRPYFDVDFFLPNFSSESNVVIKLQKKMKDQLIKYLSHFNNDKEQKNLEQNFEDSLELKNKDYQPLEKFTAKTREFKTFERYENIFQVVYQHLLLLLNHTYEDVVKMRYRMLWNLFAVVNSHKTGKCRRRPILTELNTRRNAEYQGYRCGLCDVCVPELDFILNTRKPPPAIDVSVREKEEQLATILYKGDFQFKNMNQLIEEFRDYPDVKYWQAQAILEGNVNNLPALFVAREFSPLEEYEGNSKALLEVANRKPLSLQEVQELYRSSKAFKSEQLLILNEAGTACDSPEGWKFLLEQATKPENRRNSKVVAMGDCLDFMLFIQQEDLSDVNESLKGKARKLESAFYA